MAKKTEHPREYTVRKMRVAILTARPEGMKYEEYREIRRKQQKMIKERIRQGFMVWKSKALMEFNKKGESWGTMVGRAPIIIFK